MTSYFGFTSASKAAQAVATAEKDKVMGVRATIAFAIHGSYPTVADFGDVKDAPMRVSTLKSITLLCATVKTKTALKLVYEACMASEAVEPSDFFQFLKTAILVDSDKPTWTEGKGDTRKVLPDAVQQPTVKTIEKAIAKTVTRIAERKASKKRGSQPQAKTVSPEVPAEAMNDKAKWFTAVAALASISVACEWEGMTEKGMKGLQTMFGQLEKIGEHIKP
jgi:hypothetical protein